MTESVFLEDADTTIASLRKLRALGYLRRVPFDTLKIDRSFVRDLSIDRKAQVLVETILATARALRKVTVAEGVEEVREASMLAEHGCSWLHGYLISVPLPARAVASFITDWQGLDAIAPVQSALPATMYTT